MRRLITVTTALVLLFLGAGLLLPSERELRRERRIASSREELLTWLVDPERRARWAPPWLGEGAAVTASLPERGVWWDVPGVGFGTAKSAALFSSESGGRDPAEPSGTGVKWLVRLHTGSDPVRRWAGLWITARLAADMEAALQRLSSRVAEDPPRTGEGTR